MMMWAAYHKKSLEDQIEYGGWRPAQLNETDSCEQILAVDRAHVPGIV